MAWVVPIIEALPSWIWKFGAGAGMIVGLLGVLPGIIRGWLDLVTGGTPQEKTQSATSEMMSGMVGAMTMVMSMMVPLMMMSMMMQMVMMPMTMMAGAGGVRW